MNKLTVCKNVHYIDGIFSFSKHLRSAITTFFTNLGLNNWQSSEGTTSISVRHFSGSLEQPGVKVKHITGIGLTTRGTTKKERHLSVGNSLLGQIVVDNQSVFSWEIRICLR